MFLYLSYMKRYQTQTNSPSLSREQVMQTPHLLVGTVDQIGEQLQEAREEYGISYLVVFDEHMEQFAPIVAHLANQ
jgi:alkanesulfonate monooxygenase SsuD/methylene tetrahydromethanopterin reductase-like flavin-dependent oxidoreductase (luciferase family)